MTRRRNKKATAEAAEAIGERTVLLQETLQGDPEAAAEQERTGNVASSEPASDDAPPPEESSETGNVAKGDGSAEVPEGGNVASASASAALSAEGRAEALRLLAQLGLSPAEVVTAEAAPAPMLTIRTDGVDRHYVAGRLWTGAPVTVPASDFTPEELACLRGETLLRVTEER